MNGMDAPSYDFCVTGHQKNCQSPTRKLCLEFEFSHIFQAKTTNRKWKSGEFLRRENQLLSNSRNRNRTGCYNINSSWILQFISLDSCSEKLQILFREGGEMELEAPKAAIYLLVIIFTLQGVSCSKSGKNHVFIRIAIIFSSGKKITKKQSEGVRFFVNAALRIQCHIVKNTLYTDCFSAILPTVLIMVWTLHCTWAPHI